MHSPAPCISRGKFLATQPAGIAGGHAGRMMLAIGTSLFCISAQADSPAGVDYQAAQWASSCVTCHGAARPVKDSVIPSLAGKPVDEIEAKMKAYAADTTPGSLMPQIAKGYDKDTIHRIAQWYAQLKPGAQ